MNGKSRITLRSFGTTIAILALVMLVPIVSLAQVKVADPIIKVPIADPTKKVAVPEPDAGVLLLIGIGVTGLVGYGLQRRKPSNCKNTKRRCADLRSSSNGSF